MTEKLQAIQGDITKLNVDAIVNAANPSLLGGGGVDGAIHRAAGKDLLEECRSLGGCRTGEAKITKGYRLPAKYVIHTVGPVWRGGNFGESKKLRDCYKNSLELAVKYNVKTLAFPAISTGIYGFPVKEAAAIAINTAKDFLKSDNSIEKVIFVCFSPEDFELYQKMLAEIQDA